MKIRNKNKHSTNLHENFAVAVIKEPFSIETGESWFVVHAKCEEQRTPVRS